MTRIGQFYSDARIDLYVDSATGSDSNTGEETNPLSTLAEAERRTPLNIAALVFWHVKPGNYTWPIVRDRNLGSTIIVYADDTWDPTVYTTFASGTTTAGTGVGVLVDLAGGIAVDAYRNKWLEMTSGAAVGQRRLIRNNTATDIIPASSFGAFGGAPAPISGDTYKIFDNAVIVDLDANIPASDDAVVLCSGSARNTSQGEEGAPGSYVFVGIDFTSGANSNVGIAAPVTFYGCNLPNRLQWSTAHPCYFGLDDPGGITKAIVPEQQLGALSDVAWRGWGCAFPSSPVFAPAGGSIYGYFGLASGGNGFGQDPNGLGTISWIGGSGGAASAFAAGVVVRLGSRVDSTRLLLDGTLDGTVTVGRGGRCYLGLVQVNAPAGKRAVVCFAGSDTYISGSGGLFPAEGESVDTLSVDATLGGRVHLIDGIVTFGRAAGNDYSVGNGAPQNKAFFSASGVSLDHDNGSHIVRV